MPRLTLPEIVTLAPQPYLAISERVRAPFGATMDRVVPELYASLEAAGIEPAGALFIKYDRITMPDLEIQIGVPTHGLHEGGGRLRAGTLPGGKYARVTYHGPYDRLRDVNAVLLGWGQHCGLRWDVAHCLEGERFAARLEIYETDPREEPDVEQWTTVVAIRVADADP